MFLAAARVLKRPALSHNFVSQLTPPQFSAIPSFFFLRRTSSLMFYLFTIRRLLIIDIRIRVDKKHGGVLLGQ